MSERRKERQRHREDIERQRGKNRKRKERPREKKKETRTEKRGLKSIIAVHNITGSVSLWIQGSCCFFQGRLLPHLFCMVSF